VARRQFHGMEKFLEIEYVYLEEIEE